MAKIVHVDLPHHLAACNAFIRQAFIRRGVRRNEPDFGELMQGIHVMMMEVKQLVKTRAMHCVALIGASRPISPVKKIPLQPWAPPHRLAAAQNPPPPPPPPPLRHRDRDRHHGVNYRLMPCLNWI
jgi:hypothetical protein